MIQENAFLAAIQENPADDGPRLIFADWLGERGTPDRAEFIRIQIALDRLPADDPRRVELLARASALLREGQVAWLDSPWNEVLAGVHYHRGFAHAVTMHPRTFQVWAEDFFSRFPTVRWIWFHENSGRTHELLDFYHEPKGYYAELLRSPNVARLEGLSLRDNQVGDAAVVALAGSPHAAGLKSLDLSGNRIGVAGVQALADSPHLAHLNDLDLGDNRLPRNAEVVLRSRFGERVRFTTEWGRPFTGGIS